MDRTAAVRRVNALREVRVDRGASPHEAMTARAIRERLEKKYALTAADVRPPAPRPVPRVNFADFLRRTQEEINWWFDPSTGNGSENVTVHHYQNPANWKIEIDQRR